MGKVGRGDGQQPGCVLCNVCTTFKKKRMSRNLSNCLTFEQRLPDFLPFLHKLKRKMSHPPASTTTYPLETFNKSENFCKNVRVPNHIVNPIQSGNSTSLFITVKKSVFWYCVIKQSFTENLSKVANFDYENTAFHKAFNLQNLKTIS